MAKLIVVFDGHPKPCSVRIEDADSGDLAVMILSAAQAMALRMGCSLQVLMDLLAQKTGEFGEAIDMLHTTQTGAVEAALRRTLEREETHDE